MDEATLIALALVVFGWAIVSERLATSNLTGPLVFLVAGFLLGNSDWGIVGVDVESSTVHLLAEVTLALLLFADASSVRLAAARSDLRLTGRLLGVGLPFSILAGTGLALVLFPSLPLALAGLVGASLAPTDAALSASVIADERLPLRIRRVLNVESGLNDGIATPVVTFCIAATATALGLVAHATTTASAPSGNWRSVSPSAGCSGSSGAPPELAHRHGWMQPGFPASGRVVAGARRVPRRVRGRRQPVRLGLHRRTGLRRRGAGRREDVDELTEQVGSLLSLVALVRLRRRLRAARGRAARRQRRAVRGAEPDGRPDGPGRGRAVGSGEDRSTIAFVGWFGPRGLASVVFALLAIEELGGTDPRVDSASPPTAPTTGCASSPTRWRRRTRRTTTSANIVTPMLVVHGDKDYRVPIGDGLRLWYELVRGSADENGVTPHRFLYFPDENHWILSPNNSRAWYETVLAFVDQHVLGKDFVRPEVLG